ncbi:hypothetical protein YC2023_051497 [Brassica napus]
MAYVIDFISIFILERLHRIDCFIFSTFEGGYQTNLVGFVGARLHDDFVDAISDHLMQDVLFPPINPVSRNHSLISLGWETRRFCMEEENTILMDINLVLAGVYNYLEKALKDMNHHGIIMHHHIEWMDFTADKMFNLLESQREYYRVYFNTKNTNTD